MRERTGDSHADLPTARSRSAMARRVPVCRTTAIRGKDH